MSIFHSIIGLFSPSYRKHEKFRSMMIHPDTRVLYDDFLSVCAMEGYAGGNGSETVATMITWMKSRFGAHVCSSIEDLRHIIVQGGWDRPIDEQMEAHPALFEAIAFATQGMHRYVPELPQNNAQAAAMIQNGMRRR
jgi:hypothetical protein